MPAGSPGGTANFDGPAPYPAGVAAIHDKKNGEYVLNGRKRWPVNAGGWELQGADANVCIVRTDPEAEGSRGLSAIVVPRDGRHLLQAAYRQARSPHLPE